MKAPGPSALRVAYAAQDAPALLAQHGTLAVIAFGPQPSGSPDGRCLRVPLPAISGTAPYEHWSVAATVATGAEGDLHWSAGGGWRVVALAMDAARRGGLAAASEHAYRLLLTHIDAAPERHVQRIWNYLGAINDGEGDDERYRLFCSGRGRALAAHGITHYPAATAIGHHGARGLLVVYALSATHAGHPLENPRQVSAWEYPRQYGPTAPNFARAMRLPGGGMAISGTAAVVGHASHHQGDAAAQVDEACANIATLLTRAQLGALDDHSPLKVYVRHLRDVPVIEAALTRHLDAAVPRLLLQGDICRRELLVEIDGWRLTRAD